MKIIKVRSIFITLFFLLLVFTACDTKSESKTDTGLPASNLSDQIPSSFSVKESQTYQEEWIGTFKGTCPSYNMKNKYGEDLVIYGNYVTLPSADYIFDIYNDNTCSIYMHYEGEDKYSCHNVPYKVSSNSNGFALTMLPITGSDCGGNEMILIGKNGMYNIEPGVVGEPAYSVKKTQ